MFKSWILLLISSVAAHAHEAPSPCEGRILPSSQQRQMALAIEISKMQPPQRGGVFELSSRSFSTLSRQNRDRLETAVLETYPLPQPVDPDFVRTLSGYVQNIAFEFLGEADSANPDRFLFQLLGGTRLVGFQIFAVQRGHSLTSLHRRLFVDQLRLKPRFARDHGVVMPHFPEVQSLIEFFWSWNLDSIETLREKLGSNIPPSVQSKEDFLNYVTSESAANLFSEGKARERLSPLREKLSALVMTYEDAEHFFQQVLIHYLNFQISTGKMSLEKVDRLFREPGGIDSLFQCSLFWIQWDGASLHIPLQVPHSELTFANVADTHP